MLRSNTSVQVVLGHCDFKASSLQWYLTLKIEKKHSWEQMDVYCEQHHIFGRDVDCVGCTLSVVAGTDVSFDFCCFGYIPE